MSTTASTETTRRGGAWFWDRPVGVKIAAAIAIMGVLLGLVGAWSALSLVRAGNNLDTVRDLTEDLQGSRSEEHTSELQSRGHLVCRLLLEKKKTSKQQLL